MKKLSKLTINPSKVIKNEELVNLKGGYGGYDGVACCLCRNTDTGEFKGYMLLATPGNCGALCMQAYGKDHWGYWTCP